MLGRNAVADRAGFSQVLDQNQAATIGQRLADHLGARHLRQQARDTLGHGIQVDGIRRNQYRLRQFVMLSLRKQIHCHPVRRRGAVGNNEDFRRPGDHVDADRAEDMTFGIGHIGITRADDLVYLRHSRRTVSQGTDRLRPTNGKDAINAGNRRSRQHQRVTFATRRRYNHNEFAHTRHLSRDRVHEHGGRIGRFAAWHVKTDAIQWGDALAEQGAVGLGVGPAFHALTLMKCANALRRCL